MSNIDFVDVHGRPALPLPEAVMTDTTAAHAEPAERVAAATVWVFVSVDCPIANAMLPELQSIANDYAGRAACFLVYVDDGVSSAQRVEHLRSYGLQMDSVVDQAGCLVRYAGVSVTPEAVVFDPVAKIVYRGRIDDRYPDLGVRRPEARRHELRDALEDLCAGRAVRTAAAAAVGCAIEAAVEKGGPR